MIDDGIKSRGHRKNVFSPKFDHVGIAFGYHKTFEYMCVLDYSGGGISIYESSVPRPTRDLYEQLLTKELHDQRVLDIPSKPIPQQELIDYITGKKPVIVFDKGSPEIFGEGHRREFRIISPKGNLPIGKPCDLIIELKDGNEDVHYVLDKNKWIKMEKFQHNGKHYYHLHVKKIVAADSGFVVGRNYLAKYKSKRTM